MINFGRYNTRIEIQENAQERNEFGEYTDSLKTIATPFASVRTKNASRLINNVEQTITVTEIRTRYNEVIEAYTPDMIVMINGFKYEIDSVIDFNMSKQELTITCRRTE